MRKLAVILLLALAVPTGAQTVRYSQIEGAPVNVLDFGADPTGTVDSTQAIQEAVSKGPREVWLPPGVYRVSRPIRPDWNVKIRGAGPGNYFIIGGSRTTVIKPSASFSGSGVVVIDSAAAPAIVGTSISDVTIDMTDIPEAHVYGLEIRSLTNPDTFSNVRIIGSGWTSLFIGSALGNPAAYPSDGILFQNLVIFTGLRTPRASAVVVLNGAYETAFRDSKIMGWEDVRAGRPATAGTKAVHVLALAEGYSSNAVTFDGVSFTGVETGVMVENTAVAQQGPRWVRVLNSTFEGVRYGMQIKGVSGGVSSAAQFNTFGPGNRFQAMADRGAQVFLNDFANNNTVICDEYAPTVGGHTVKAAASATGNTILGQPAGMSIAAPASNVVFGRGRSGGLDVSGFAVGALESPALLSGWSQYSAASRSAVGHWKDPFGVVHLQGYVTGGSVGYNQPIFTLPPGSRPLKVQEFVIPASGGVGLLFIDEHGNVALESGSNGWVSLNGVTFRAGF